MCGFFYHLYLYLLGAVTGVPLLLVFALGVFVIYGTTPIGDDDPSKSLKNALRTQSEGEESASIEAGGPARRVEGWLVIRETFYPRKNGTSFFGGSGNNKAANGSNTALEGDDEDDRDMPGGTSTPVNGSAAASTKSSDTKTSSINTAASAWGQIKNYATTRSSQAPTELFYAVLKGKVLYLYDDDKQGPDSLKGVIGVENYNVSIETPDGPFEGRDGQMFAKRNALCLTRAAEDGEKRLSALSKGMESTPGGGPGTTFDSEGALFYLFSKNNSKMEDFYLALNAVSASPPTMGNIVNLADILALVDVLRTEPEPIPAHWLNAMLSRVWFSLYQTKAVEQLIIEKIMKKLSKVKLPSTLEPITVREVNVGTFPPIFSKPMLKNLTKEGDAEFAVHMNYAALPNQPFRITIKTAWHPGISTLDIHLVLAVVVRSISGDLTIKIKPPPSNRVWYGFTSMPKIDYDIVPIMNDRRVTPDVVLNMIKTRFEDVIRDSIVKENMDDIAFFDSSPYATRGGIFDDAHKRYTAPVENESDNPNGDVDMTTSNEDPSSATPEISGLRLRHPNKSRTVAVPPAAGLSSKLAEEEGSTGNAFPRTDTAPPALTNGPNTHAKKLTATQLRSWLTSAGVSGVPHNSTGEPSRTSLDGSGARSRSVERGRTGSLSSQVSLEAAPKQRPASMAASGASIESGSETPVGAVTPTTVTATENSPEVSSSVLSLDSTISDTPAISTTFGGKPNSPSSSKVSLISSIRTGDKKALASQVNLARDNMKKWGATWAAKRQRFKAEEDTERPAAYYRPPEEDPIADAVSARQSIEHPGTTLQERLAAATTKVGSAAIPLPSTRERAGSGASTSSRVSLLSASHNAGHAATSPPKWTLAEAKPTTEVHNAAASGSSISVPHHSLPHPPTGGHSSAHPHSTVNMQPHAGRTMVVPRVPKRPGEVTGLGSNPNGGMTRRISQGEEERRAEKSEGVTGSHEDLSKTWHAGHPKGERSRPPPLPKRHWTSEATPDSNERTQILETGVSTSETDKVAASGTSHSKNTAPSPPVADMLTRSDSAPSAVDDTSQSRPGKNVASIPHLPPPPAKAHSEVNLTSKALADSPDAVLVDESPLAVTPRTAEQAEPEPDLAPEPGPAPDPELAAESEVKSATASNVSAGHDSYPNVSVSRANTAAEGLPPEPSVQSGNGAGAEGVEVPSNAAEALRQALHRSEEASVVQD